jgi:RecJ-like exonuclease
MLNSHQEQMLGALGWLVSHSDSFKLTPKLRYIYSGSAVNPAMVGEALSRAMESGLIAIDRPILWLTDIGMEEIKVTARSAPRLAMQGVDVGRALERAANAVGGWGGGHDVAASARVPRGRMDEFIAKLDQTLSRGVERPMLTS